MRTYLLEKSRVVFQVRALVIMTKLLSESAICYKMKCDVENMVLVSSCTCQASAERNYHIFYQLCASRELPEMRSFKLGETLLPECALVHTSFPFTVSTTQ